MNREDAWEIFIAGFESTNEGWNGEILNDPEEADTVREQFEEFWTEYTENDKKTDQ